VSEFEYSAHFDKDKMASLAESIRKDLVDEGVTANLWSMEPWKLSFDVRTARSDYSTLLCKIYKRPEVMTVSMGVEPGTRLIMMHVALSERWFVDEKRNGQASKRHPEAEGGSLA
jgi:hypothetical protein